MSNDLMELKEKFGASAAELGINEEIMFSYKTTGKFFGWDCDCYLYFDENKKFVNYNIYVPDTEGGDLIGKLDDIYPEPAASAMTPYAAVNGGAVYSNIYKDKDTVITVSKGQNNAYYSVNVKPNPNPGVPGAAASELTGAMGLFQNNIAALPVGYDNGGKSF